MCKLGLFLVGLLLQVAGQSPRDIGVWPKWRRLKQCLTRQNPEKQRSKCGSETPPARQKSARAYSLLSPGHLPVSGGHSCDKQSERRAHRCAERCQRFEAAARV